MLLTKMAADNLSSGSEVNMDTNAFMEGGSSGSGGHPPHTFNQPPLQHPSASSYIRSQSDHFGNNQQHQQQQQPYETPAQQQQRIMYTNNSKLYNIPPSHHHQHYNPHSQYHEPTCQNYHHFNAPPQSQQSNPYHNHFNNSNSNQQFCDQCDNNNNNNNNWDNKKFFYEPSDMNNSKDPNNSAYVVDLKSIPITFEKSKCGGCHCNCSNQPQPSQTTPGSTLRHYDTIVGCGPNGVGVTPAKQHSPPLPGSHMQLRNTLQRQQSASFINQNSNQSPYNQPKLVSHYSTNGFNTTPLPRQHPSLGGGRKSLAGGIANGRNFGLRSLSQAMGFTGFGDKKESIYVPTGDPNQDLIPLNMKLFNESQQKLPSLLKSVQKSSDATVCIKASTIDNYSRVIFPVTFISFHIIYWTYYLKISHW